MGRRDGARPGVAVEPTPLGCRALLGCPPTRLPADEPPAADAAATDVLWTLSHPAVWSPLVGERGWSSERFGRWRGDSFCLQLLEPPPAARALSG